MSSETSGPRAFPPVIAQYSGGDFVVGGGVAIFHIATGRVVVCSNMGRRSGMKYYFLPKGRRDAGEESGTGAEREGYEEVCLTPGPWVECLRLQLPR
jgi:predicted NUDIX family NTP pyrophosphohydrolase